MHSFSYSVVDLLLCLLLYCPIFSQALAVSHMASHYLSTIILTAGMRCLCWYVVFGFQTWSCALWPNICTLVFWTKHKVLCFVQKQLCKPQLFGRVLLATLPNKPNLFSLFLIALWSLRFSSWDFFFSCFPWVESPGKDFLLNTHLNISDYQWIKSIWLSANGCCLHSLDQIY